MTLLALNLFVFPMKLLIVALELWEYEYKMSSLRNATVPETFQLVEESWEEVLQGWL